MKELRLLPLQLGETVEQKVSAFRTMDDLVRNGRMLWLSLLFFNY